MTTPERLLALVLEDPRRAAGEAAEAVATAPDDGARSVALRAAGLAAHALHEPASAARYLRRAIRLARAAGDRVAEAEARMSHSLVLDELGHPAEALREVERACRELRGQALGRARMQQSLILRRVGRSEEAMRGYDAALVTFRETGDAVWEARTLGNRGLLHCYRGATAPAMADLHAAEAIFAALELPAALAQTQHNIGYVCAQAGDVVAALAHYERAREQLRAIGATALTEQNRAEFLLSSRLLPEAREAAAASIEAARSGRNSLMLGQSQVLAARIELMAGATETAGALAVRARATFVRQGRPAWAAQALRVQVGARIATSGADRRAARSLERAGDALAASSLLLRAWEAWIEAAWCAATIGDVTRAQLCLAKAAVARTSAPAPLRARMWHVSAMLALAGGEPGVAKRHAALGYREVERHRATVGATELGIRRSADGVGLAALRLRLSLRDHDWTDALRWLQRARSAALRLPPARPASDPVVVDLMTELRTISASLTGPTNAAQRLLRRQHTIEAEIRQRSWSTVGQTAVGALQPSRSQLATALGRQVLLELFALDGLLHALVLRDGRLHHRPLCSVESVGDEVAALRFAVRRRLVHAGNPAAEARADVALGFSAGELERMLLVPLADLIGDRALVLAPTDALHALPWSLLPMCRGRAVSVVPSSWLWWQAAQRGRAGGGEVLIAGPAPEHAITEVRALQAGWPDARTLVGAEATVAATVRSLDGASLAHVASHGVFRADNPLFSHLVLADGQLTVCDLGLLDRAPDVLILSSCDAGLSAVHPGDELQGLAVALLGLGTRCVIASLGLVDDVTTAQLMVDMHEHLRNGARPAVALALAQSAAAERSPGVANFVCLGAG